MRQRGGAVAEAVAAAGVGVVFLVLALAPVVGLRALHTWVSGAT
jgi:hypothetical protein